MLQYGRYTVRSLRRVVTDAWEVNGPAMSGNRFYIDLEQAMKGALAMAVADVR